MVVRGFAGAPESDEVVTFEDILSGVLGDHEAELAKQLHAAAYIQPQLQVVDASSNDMRVGDRASKRKRLVYAASLGQQSSAQASAQQQQKHQPKQQQHHTRQARVKRDLPPGWRVELKLHSKGDNAGKRYKIYVAPDGKRMLSYVTAIAYHERQAGTQAAADTSPPSALPPGWKAVQQKEEGSAKSATVYVSPDNQRFSSWAQAVRYCGHKGISMPDAPPSSGPAVEVSVEEAIHWLHDLAINPVSDTDGSQHVKDALLRARQALGNLKKSKRV